MMTDDAQIDAYQPTRPGANGAEPTKPVEPFKGYFFDGAAWGVVHAETVEYAGFTYDVGGVQADTSFRYFGADEKPELPLGSVLFGRTQAFAWRGDTLRGVEVRNIDDQSLPGFWMSVDVFDHIVPTTLAARMTFERMVRRYSKDAQLMPKAIVSENETRLSASWLEGAAELRIRHADASASDSVPIAWDLRVKDLMQSITILVRIEAHPIPDRAKPLPTHSRDLVAVYDVVPAIERVLFVDHTDGPEWRHGHVKRTVGLDSMGHVLGATVTALCTIALCRSTRTLRPGDAHSRSMRRTL